VIASASSRLIICAGPALVLCELVASGMVGTGGEGLQRPNGPLAARGHSEAVIASIPIALSASATAG